MLLEFILKAFSMNILGIDIGTISVKVGIYDVYKNNIGETQTSDTEATTLSEYTSGHEQDVHKILIAINKVLDKLDQSSLQLVGHVAISGQMHGIMFWNKSEPSKNEHSRFITWMDQRCNVNHFLNGIPKMNSKIVEEMPISSGYGCATIFHLMYSDNQFLEQWKYAGNIVDFFACSLSGSDVPLMSPHMAHSWGYFDIIGNKWFKDKLESANFPTRLLPEVVLSGSVVGRCRGLTKIPENALIYVGMGDLQCSMYGALRGNLNSAINVSTSAQFAVRVTLQNLKELNEGNDDILKLPPGLVINPNFNQDDFLLVAASLNGGNVLEAFVTMLQEWVRELSATDISKEKILTFLTSSYKEKGDVALSGSGISSMTMNPILFGERYCPTEGASISDIFPFNSSLPEVYSALCLGLIKNLTKLLPLEIVSKLYVNHLKCSGGALKRQKCLQDSIIKIYGPVIGDIEFTSNYDACVGAAE